MIYFLTRKNIKIRYMIMYNYSSYGNSIMIILPISISHLFQFVILIKLYIIWFLQNYRRKGI